MVEWCAVGLLTTPSRFAGPAVCGAVRMGCGVAGGGLSGGGGGVAGGSAYAFAMVATYSRVGEGGGLRAVLDSAQVEFVHGGVATAVATRDRDLVPAVTRAFGPQVSPEGSVLSLCVVAAVGSRSRINLEGNGAIAVVFSPPTVARGLQVKGVVRELREPGPIELARAEEHLLAFVAQCVQLGIAPEAPRRLFARDDFVWVQFPIDDVFDQTPGRGAGRRL